MCDECNHDVTSALYLCNVETDSAPQRAVFTIFKTYTTLKSVKCALKRQVSKHSTQEQSNLKDTSLSLKKRAVETDVPFSFCPEGMQPAGEKEK